MRGLKELFPMIIAVTIATVILLSWIWSGARFISHSRSTTAVPHAMPVPAGVAVSGASPPSAVASGGAPVAGLPQAPPKPDARLRQLAIALRMYAHDYQQSLPPMNNTSRLEFTLLPYTRQQNLFIDPFRGARFGVNPSLSGKRINSFPNPAEVIVFYQQAPDPRTGKRWVAFLDGNVKAINEQQWRTLSKVSGIKPASAPRTKPKRL